MTYTNYQNERKPHTRLCHITSLTMIDVELTEKLSAKSCSKLSMGICIGKLQCHCGMRRGDIH